MPKLNGKQEGGKKVKGWVVAYKKSGIDRDTSYWGNAELYAIFPTKADVKKWLGERTIVPLEERCFPCTVTYHFPKPKRKKPVPVSKYVKRINKKRQSLL